MLPEITSVGVSPNGLILGAEEGVLSPIVIMSFNRPSYLKALLESLISQHGIDLSTRVVVLFQDGAVSPFINKRKADPVDIEACVDCFKQMIPNGKIFESVDNLGVAMNFERAERFVFETLGVESAIFLEDDLILSSHYISVLDRLLALYSDDVRVGYLGAYGDHELSLELQYLNKNKLMTMHHNWAFAIYRRQWQVMRPYITDYLQFVRNRDYGERDHDGIIKLFLSWGYVAPGTSQDCAKTVICCLTNTIKLNTVACFGKYIGEQGLHMDPALFNARGYSLTQTMPEFVNEFEPVTQSLFDNVYGELSRWAGKTDNEETLRRDVERATRAWDVIKSIEGASSTVSGFHDAAFKLDRLHRFFDGTNLNKLAQRALHRATSRIKEGDIQIAINVATIAIKVLFTCFKCDCKLDVCFKDMKSAKVVSHGHIRIQWSDNTIRLICPVEILRPNFTNYFEPLVILSLYAESLVLLEPDGGEYVMDVGGGANAGSYSRVAFSSSLLQATLIPEQRFFTTRAFSRIKGIFVDNWIPWKDRLDVVVWRGNTTGIQVNARALSGAENQDWKWLQRLELCARASKSPHKSNLDVGVTQIVQIDLEPVKDAIVAAGFLRPAVSYSQLVRYRYAFVVDGNSSDGNDLLLTMLAGCCVLFIESRFQFRSWFYDRLEPWKTYVPLSPDLSDFDERIQWILDNPAECEKMAALSQMFARNLSLNQEFNDSLNNIRRRALTRND